MSSEWSVTILKALVSSVEHHRLVAVAENAPVQMPLDCAGKHQALQIATHNLDTFAYMAGFSGTMNGLSTEPLDPQSAFGGAFKDGPAFNERVKLLWLGMGTEKPHPFPGAIGAFRAMLDKAGVKYV